MALAVLGVIPARLHSTRLPRKVLREIAGKPMIVHVHERACRATRLSDVVVATDSDEVVAVCREFHIPAVLTSSDHPSGTDRVWEIAHGRAADVYVNIQGDEPLVTTRHINSLITPFVTHAGTKVSTLKIPATDAEITDPNAVKVVCDIEGRALYFSRLPVPYDRDGRQAVTYFKHLGLYAYTRAALDLFHSLAPSPLEHIERLEQLRFLEHGVPIMVTETPDPTIGVDTEADLAAAEARILAGG